MQFDNHGLGLGCSFVLAAIVTACALRGEEPNYEHCWNASGDATCRAEFGEEFPYCSNDSNTCGAVTALGCVAELPADGCHSPCGGGQSALQDDSCSGSADESVSETGSTGMDGCQPGCDASMVCDQGACVECTEAEQGACIQDQLWCNLASNSCEKCTSHFQCPGDAGCHLEQGTCLPPDVVVDIPQEGSSFAYALSELGGNDGTIRIHDSSSYPIGSTLVLAKNQIVAVVAVNGVRPTIPRAGLDSAAVEFAFQLSSGHLYLWGIDFSGDAGVSVVGSGKLHAEKTGFDNAHRAVSVSNGGRAELRSCMLISDNDLDEPTLRIEYPGSVDLTFSTLLARQGDHALVCHGNATALVRNSIVGSFGSDGDVHYNGIELDGDDDGNPCSYSIVNCAIEHIMDDIMIFPGLAVGDFAYADFTNVGTGNLHLILPADKFQFIAQGTSADPLDDFDGDLRAVQGLTWPGADHPTP